MPSATMNNVAENRAQRKPSIVIELPPSFDTMLKDMRAITQELKRAADALQGQADRNTRFGLAPPETSGIVEEALRRSGVVHPAGTIPGTPIRGRDVIAHDVEIAGAPEGEVPGDETPGKEAIPNPFVAYREGKAQGVKGLYADVQRTIGQHTSELAEKYALRHPVNPYLDKLGLQSNVRSARAANALRTIGAEMAQGKGIQAGLSAAFPNATGALAKGAGIIGATVSAVDKVADFATEQRATNASWQSIMGGSNRDAYGDRFRSQMFEFSNKGLLGAGAASELYRGVAETGVRDRETRENMAEFGVQNYKHLGMSVSDSMEVIKFAAKTGQESLRGVADALKEVTEAARAGGVNAQEARKNFLALAQSLSTTMAGSTATATAAAVTSAQNLLGRQFQDADFSGMANNPSLVALQAGTMGMTLPEYQSDILAGGQRGARAAIGGQTAVGQRVANDLLAMTGGRGQAIIEQFKANNRPNASGQYSQQAMNDLASELAAAGLDQNIAAQGLRDIAGINVDPATANQFVAAAALGSDPNTNVGWDPAGLYESQVKDAKARDVGKDKYGQPGPLSGLTNAMASISRIGGGGKLEQARTQHKQATRRTGKESPILDKFLDKNYDPKSRFKIQTKDGEVVMDFGQAMKFAPDQMMSGMAEIVSGTDRDKTISEATGMATDDSLMDATGSFKSARKEAKEGKSFEKWQEEQDKKSGTSVIRIEATPWLQQLLKITPPPTSPRSALHQGNTSVVPDNRPTGRP